MALRIKYVIHKDITSNILVEICLVKRAFGAYELESQLQWIDNNIVSDDIHVLLYDERKMVAYMTITSVSVFINEMKVNAMGIGNVCSAVQGKGYAKSMMNLVNVRLKEEDNMGVLFCKNSLVTYYSALSWGLITTAKFDLQMEMSNIHIMVYNPPVAINKLVYNGPLF